MCNSHQVLTVRSNSEAEELMDRNTAKNPDWFEPRSQNPPRSQLHDFEDLYDDFDRFKQLDARMRSYEDPNWPSDVPLAPEALARAGWFYIGREDRVQCPWCGGCVFNWVPGDSALGEHRRHFPHCEFVQEYIANSFKRSEATPPASRRKPRVTSHNWRDTEAVRAAKDLDMSDDVIERAAKVLLQRKGEFSLINHAAFQCLWF